MPALCADDDELKSTVRGDIYAGGKIAIAVVVATSENSELVLTSAELDLQDLIIAVMGSPAWALHYRTLRPRVSFASLVSSA